MNKLDDTGMRLCDQTDCELIATHTLVWTDHKYYCMIHTNKAIGIADYMGFPTPRNTVRKMTIDEMMPD